LKFAKAFRRHVDCPDVSVPGTATVRQVLDAYFGANPAVRSYVVDEAFALRRHVAVFVNDRQLVDRRELSDPVGDADEVYVFQALSGG
jgi:molybdopterin converting factor small subunit